MIPFYFNKPMEEEFQRQDIVFESNGWIISPLGFGKVYRYLLDIEPKDVPYIKVIFAAYLYD